MRTYRKTATAKQWMDDHGRLQIGWPLMDQWEQLVIAANGYCVLCSTWLTGEIVEVPSSALKDYPESPIPEPTK
jgi:hypothetical protein